MKQIEYQEEKDRGDSGEESGDECVDLDDLEQEIKSMVEEPAPTTIK